MLIGQDGSSVKANITTKKGDPTSDKDKGSATYSIDLSGLSPSEKKEAMMQFNQLVIENQLRFSPAGKGFNLISKGPDDEFSGLMEQQLLEDRNRVRFEEKGIKVLLNGKLIIPEKNEATPEESHIRQRSSSFQVPRGAPKPRKPGE